MVEGKRKAGAAVVDGKQVIWVSSLPEGTSAQKAELVALIQALRMAEGKSINIYTDSRYAFATAHIHRAIYRQRGLLTSAGKDIKNKEEILLIVKFFIHFILSLVNTDGCTNRDKRRTSIPWISS